MKDSRPDIEDEMRRRVMLLDGSTGVMLQQHPRPGTGGMRGRRFTTHAEPAAPPPDIMCLSHPAAVAEIHRAYLDAGADIIVTVTLNANALSQRPYGTGHLVRDINTESARIARREADLHTALDPSRPRYVAGSVGPTAYRASLTSGPHAIDPDTLTDTLAEQCAALLDGGVDMLFIETAYDLANALAAATAATRAMTVAGRRVPLVFSMTLCPSGALLSGHTPEEFTAAVAPFAPLAVGFNCSDGPAGLTAPLRRLAATSPFATVCYPSAGLPGAGGAYPVDAAAFAAVMAPLLADGCLNIVGGCCGTTPDHTAALRTLLDTMSPAPHTFIAAHHQRGHRALCGRAPDQ